MENRTNETNELAFRTRGGRVRLQPTTKADKKLDKTPETALKNVRTDIANLLGWFDCEMAKDQKVDWGLVGQMEATRAWLIDTLSVMSGVDVNAIKESLDQAKQK